jgi:hypothetical protein
MEAKKKIKVAIFNTFAPFNSSMETSTHSESSSFESEEKNEMDELKDRLKDLD